MQSWQWWLLSPRWQDTPATAGSITVTDYRGHNNFIMEGKGGLFALSFNFYIYSTWLSSPLGFYLNPKLWNLQFRFFKTADNYFLPKMSQNDNICVEECWQYLYLQTLFWLEICLLRRVQKSNWSNAIQLCHSKYNKDTNTIQCNGLRVANNNNNNMDTSQNTIKTQWYKNKKDASLTPIDWIQSILSQQK